MLANPTSGQHLRAKHGQRATDAPRLLPVVRTSPAVAGLALPEARSASTTASEGLPGVHQKGRWSTAVRSDGATVATAQARPMHVPVGLVVPLGRTRPTSVALMVSAVVDVRAQANGRTTPAGAYGSRRFAIISPLATARRAARLLVASATTTADINATPLSRGAKRAPGSTGGRKLRWQGPSASRHAGGLATLVATQLEGPATTEGVKRPYHA